jgi:hypothetical protein
MKADDRKMLESITKALANIKDEDFDSEYYRAIFSDLLKKYIRLSWE